MAHKFISSIDFSKEKMNKITNDREWARKIKALNEDSKFWNNASPHTLSKWDMDASGTAENTIKFYKEETRLSINKVKRHLGAKKYKELANPDSKANRQNINSEKFTDFAANFTVFYLPIIFIFAVIMFLIFAPNQYENCEEVTWYEYGEKKTGIICDDEAKAQMESIREEKGVYEKKE